MITIMVDQSISNSALHKPRILESNKNLYKSEGKCDYQQQYKTILEAYMVSTPKLLPYTSPIAVGTLGTLKKPSARNLLSQFSALFDVKPKTDVQIM